jgi:glyoxylase-like metal-dependent hydrolase (beta-lactamase superfamily II)
MTVDWLLETHAHADHLSAAPYLQQRLGGRIAIGNHIRQVQTVFKKAFNLPDMDTDGRDFDYLFNDEKVFQIGALDVRALHTPGHTPACVTLPVLLLPSVQVNVRAGKLPPMERNGVSYLKIPVKLL